MHELINESKPKFSLSDLDYYLQHPEQISDEEFEATFDMTRAEAERDFGGHVTQDRDEDDTDIDFYLNHPELMPNDQFESIFGISREEAKQLFGSPSKVSKRWTNYGDPIHE
jgi:hypothetical protein